MEFVHFVWNWSSLYGIGLLCMEFVFLVWNWSSLYGIGILLLLCFVRFFNLTQHQH